MAHLQTVPRRECLLHASAINLRLSENSNFAGGEVTARAIKVRFVGELHRYGFRGARPPVGIDLINAILVD